MNYPVNISALFASLVAKVSERTLKFAKPFPVYFDCGRYLEVDLRLKTKTGHPTTAAKKYPLIWLNIPYSERYDLYGNLELRRVELVIVADTRSISTTPERFSTNFTDRLWPIFDELVRAINSSGYFDTLQEIEKIDQPFWDGKDAGTQVANMFGDFVDCVQVRNLSLTVNESTCLRFPVIGPTA